MTREPLSKEQEALETAEALTPAAEVQEPSVEEAESSVDDAFATLKNDLNQLQDRYVRLHAEFDNYKKREIREREASLKYANERLLVDLLPIIDNLESALIAGSQHGKSDLMVGIQMVHKQFVDVLGRFGVQQFSAQGQAFNPNFHEALSEQESTDVEPGKVVQEYQKGYTLHGRLIRPARVIVAKAP